MKTTFFRSCFGVFQGGGCRAAALVGAYKEAVGRGVQFIEVAGTSAGSIVAALIGAGASPEQITEFVNDLDFRKFLMPPEKTTPHGWLIRLIASYFGRLGNLLLYQGFHSSIEIERWMESCLTKLLGPHRGPIPFSLLELPTSVVAADILGRKAHVWNQRTSPQESVAAAVRASCSIPFFFQPPRERFIDGGTLSNLPTFVFSENAAGRPLTSRVLAFVLKGDEEKMENWGTFPYLKAVANTVVDGAQELQTTLQGNVHTISIPTGSVKATDFEKIDRSAISNLISSGKMAATNFFDSELTQVRIPRLPSSVCYDRADLYNSLASHLSEEVKDVVISEHDTEFVFDIFPCLFLWKLRGARVRVLVPTIEKDAAKGAYRRKVLVKMGVELLEGSPPFRGYLLNSDDPERGTAYISPAPGANASGVEAVIYQGAMHAAVINSLAKEMSFDESFAHDFRPKLLSDSEDTILRRLKGVSQYGKNGVEISLEIIPLSSLLSLSSYVSEFKYRQAQFWAEEHRNAGIKLFAPSAIEMLGNVRSIVAPPVVEQSGKSFVLIQGSARAKFLLDSGHEQVKCAVVRGIQDPLPGATSAALAKVRVAGRDLRPDFRYEDFNYALFRKIELAVRPLDSLNG
jgi:predicted acylesterase/phospholipase RssA